MSLKDSVPVRLFAALASRVVLPLYTRLGLSPSGVTVLGLILAATIPPAFLVSPWLGLAALALTGLADATDGLYARATGRESSYGAFLDSCLDRLADALALLGFWLLFDHGPQLAWSGVLMFAALAATFTISYAKARAQGLGAACEVGLMERAPRMFYLLGWALLLALWPGAREEILWVGLGVYLMLTAQTAVRRLVHVRGELARIERLGGAGRN